MDDTFKRLLITLVILLPATVGAVDLTYVSEAKTDELKHEFETARAIEAGQKSLVGAPWRCDMFGVRSRLQVKHDVELYEFKTAADQLTNVGAQPIAGYRRVGVDLEGRGDGDLLDQVRLTKGGELISKLSLPGRGLVVSYAVCRRS